MPVANTTEAGLLLVDKLAGPTSHDVVAWARRALGAKVGHTGTLDPFATGLLLLLVGSLTRLAELYHVHPKTYDATMRLGVTTDTDDATGRVVEESRAWRSLSPERIEAELTSWRGSGVQRPSTFSAKQVRGRRAHETARAGGTPSLADVPITIHEIALRSIEGRDVRFRASVSTGTYIRALARDIGAALGCGAHLTRLRRTAIGPFEVTDAIRSDEIGSAVPAEGRGFRFGVAAIPWLARRDLDAEELDAILHGRPIDGGEALAVTEGAGSTTEPIALTRGRRVVAIAEREGDRLRPRKVFPT